MTQWKYRTKILGQHEKSSMKMKRPSFTIPKSCQQGQNNNKFLSLLLGFIFFFSFLN